MVMVSARLTRRWRLSYRHDLANAAIAAPVRRRARYAAGAAVAASVASGAAASVPWRQHGRPIQLFDPHCDCCHCAGAVASTS
jgi:hypothetical protein